MAIPAQSGAVVICPMEAHLGGTQTADHEANASEDIARDVAGGGLRVAKRPWQPAEDDRLLELVQRVWSAPVGQNRVPPPWQDWQAMPRKV